MVATPSFALVAYTVDEAVAFLAHWLVIPQEIKFGLENFARATTNLRQRDLLAEAPMRVVSATVWCNAGQLPIVAHEKEKKPLAGRVEHGSDAAKFFGTKLHHFVDDHHVIFSHQGNGFRQGSKEEKGPMAGVDANFCASAASCRPRHQLATHSKS